MKSIVKAQEQMASQMEELTRSKDMLLSSIGEKTDVDIAENIKNIDEKIADLIGQTKQYFEEKIEHVYVKIDAIESEFNTKVLATEGKYNELSVEQQNIQVRFNDIDNIIKFKIEELKNNISTNDKELDNILDEQLKEKILPLLNTELSNMRNEFNSIVEALKENSNAYDDAIINNAKRIDLIIENFDNKITNSNVDIEEIIANERGYYLSEIDKIVDSYKNREIDSENFTENYEADIEMLQERISKIENVFADTVEGLETKVYDLFNSFDSERDKIIEELDNIRNGMARDIAELDNNINSTRDDSLNMMDDVKDSMSEYVKSIIDDIGIINKVDDFESNIKNSIEHFENNIDNERKNTDEMKKELLNIMSENYQVLKTDIDSKIKNFENKYKNIEEEKAFESIAINNELEKLTEETNKSLESVVQSFDNKMAEAQLSLDKIQNDRLRELTDTISNTKIGLDDFIQEIKDEVEGAKKTILGLEDKGTQLSIQLDDLSNVEIELNGKVNTNAAVLQKHIDGLYEQVSNIIGNVENSINEKEKILLEKIDYLQTEINGKIDIEVSNLKPYVLESINNFIGERSELVGSIDDVKKNVKELESNLVEELERSFSIAQDKVEVNLDLIEKRFVIHEDDLINKFKEEFEKKSGEACENTNEIIKNIENEYSQKISSFQETIDAMKNSLNSSIDDAKNELTKALDIKDDFTFAIKDNEKYLGDLENNLKNLQDSFEPTIQKIESTFHTRVNEVYERIDDANGRLIQKENEFKKKLDNIVDDFDNLKNNKSIEIENVLTGMKENEKQLLDSINHNMEIFLNEKSGNFDNIKSDYEQMFSTLEQMKSSLNDSINNKIQESNLLIDERTSMIASRADENYKEHIEKISEHLNETISSLIKEAKDNVDNAKYTLEKEQRDRLNEIGSETNNLQDLIENLSKDLSRENTEYDIRLDKLADVFAQKEKSLLESFRDSTEKLQDDIRITSDNFTNIIKQKEDDMNLGYENLRDIHDTLELKVSEYLSELEKIKKCEDMTEDIKNNINNLYEIINKTNDERLSLEKTVNDFDELKNMQSEIVRYTEELTKEREILKETEEYINIITALNEEVKNKVDFITEEKSTVSAIEEGVKNVIQFTNDLEDKINEIRHKDENLTMILTRIASSETETDEVEKKVVEIKASLIHLEENRERIIDKLQKVEKDTAILTKNDKKIQELISKFDQFDIMIDELGEQRDQMIRIKNVYADQANEVENNLRRADEVIQTLNNLLTDADKYIFDDGSDITTEDKKYSRSKKYGIKVDQDKYVGIDSKKTKLVIDLYKSGWSYENIVTHTSFKQEEVETIINRWKEKQSRV